MRYALIYISWLGTWLCSIMYYAFEHEQSAVIWLELSRFMVFFSIAAFSFLAADKRPKSIAYQVQLEHMVFIVGAKAIEHFFGVLDVLGLPTLIDPYKLNIANYVLAALYIIISPIRISYLKRKAFWN